MNSRHTRKTNRILRCHRTETLSMPRTFVRSSCDSLTREEEFRVGKTVHFVYCRELADAHQLQFTPGPVMESETWQATSLHAGGDEIAFQNRGLVWRWHV